MDGDVERLVALLGDPHRRVAAYRQLLGAGRAALPGVRRGLLAAYRKTAPRVRRA